MEGFLSGGGLLLVHDDALLALLDDWLADIPADAFDNVLPLLRRTFGGFDAGERRAIGERIGRRHRDGVLLRLQAEDVIQYLRLADVRPLNAVAVALEMEELLELPKVVPVRRNGVAGGAFFN